MNIEQMIEIYPQRPHLVILGAGASKDAMPDGDANGKPLPVMSEFISTINLTDYIGKIEGVPKTDNIEDVYSWLANQERFVDERIVVENGIREYFSNITLPDTLTKYDLLVLSLRQKDCIATFNWDGLLVQAYQRMQKITTDLPQMVFLHGNVEVGYCPECKTYGYWFAKCHKCGEQLQSVPLLYPVKNKNYQKNEFISEQWKILEDFISKAALITIYGYSAPKTDIEAINILKKAFARLGTPRYFDIIEIIEHPKFDTKNISEAWLDLSEMARDHLKLRRSVFDSYMFRSPRRSLEFLHKNRIASSWWGESSIKFTQEDINEDKISALETKILPLLKNEDSGNPDVI